MHSPTNTSMISVAAEGGKPSTEAASFPQTLGSLTLLEIPCCHITFKVLIDRDQNKDMNPTKLPTGLPARTECKSESRHTTGGLGLSPQQRETNQQQ